MDKTDVLTRMGIKASNTAREAVRRAYVHAQAGNQREALTLLREAESAFNRASGALDKASATERATGARIRTRQVARGGSTYARIMTISSKAQSALA